MTRLRDGAAGGAAPVPTKAPPADLTYSMLRVKIADYATWRTSFDGSEADRVARGATGNRQVFRDLDDPTMVIHVIEWKDEKGPREWFGSATLKDAQKTATVTTVQEIRFLRRV